MQSFIVRYDIMDEIDTAAEFDELAVPLIRKAIEGAGGTLVEARSDFGHLATGATGVRMFSNFILVMVEGVERPRLAIERGMVWVSQALTDGLGNRADFWWSVKDSDKEGGQS